MYHSKDIIQHLFSLLEKEGVNFKRFGPKDLEKVMAFCDTKACIIWINNTSSITPTFINDYGMRYYGFEHKDLSKYGFGLYEKFLHPDHFDDVHKTIEFFRKSPQDLFYMTYLARDAARDWRWTYSIAKAMNFKKNGSPEYVLSLVFDIEDLMADVLEEKLELDNDSEAKSMYSKFQKLTKREKQILHLIAAEHTSQEIAEKLFIEASTVDTHRKHIISKLEVKNSMGLVQYALKFPPKQ